MNKDKQKRSWLFQSDFRVENIEKEFKLLNKYERWRRVAKILKVSKDARVRLEWIIYNFDGHSVKETCDHFVISKKTFHKWFKVFDEDNIHTIRLLENQSRAPKHVRQKEITPLEQMRVVLLKKKHIRYGKMKISKIYERTYGAPLSSWKIQGVITDKKLHYHPKKNALTQGRRLKSKNKRKKSITDLKLHRLASFQKKAGYIICMDTIVIHWMGLKRYVFTAIDKYGKFAFARMYKTKSTVNSSDFLYRLYYLLDGQMPRVGHDNGSEFKKHFASTCAKLKIEQYHSRPRTPKDNPDNERFNQTLEKEFLDLEQFRSDPELFNQKLTEWLVEYNFNRPHETLNYETPLEFSKELPMYSSCTWY